MSENSTYYQGSGQRLAERGQTLPPHAERRDVRDPARYLADPGLRHAVNVALALSQPLLLTGAPGTGKTELAYSLHWELDLPLEIFHAKTTSVARDLFYRYDSLRHFHAVNTQKKDLPVRNFIQLAALGRAILRAADTPTARSWLPESEAQAAPVRSIVLIDEIDKAPRDLPNDVLHEFERLEFSIEELEQRETHRAAAAFRPILILTSNSEKNLPDAFLRRCVYYHIPSPDKEGLRKILEQRVGQRPGVTDALLAGAVKMFEDDIRGNLAKVLKKLPATAECIAWVEVLAAQGIDLQNPADRERLRASFCVLAKTDDDLKKLRDGLAPL